MLRRSHARHCAIAIVSAIACAQGDGTQTTGPATIATVSDTAEGDGTSGDGSDSGSTAGTAGSGGADDSSGSGPAPSCSDGVHNGDETDVDCGGSCSPCGTGQGCGDAADCDTTLCEGGMCCTAFTYDKSTGLISGNAMVCCDGEDIRIAYEKCGDGQNYTCEPVDENCASTSEGAMNNGSACVSITCQALDCDPG
jgi:hypothetical protein